MVWLQYVTYKECMQIPQLMLPQVRQGLHSMEIRVDNLQILKNRANMLSHKGAKSHILHSVLFR